MTNQPQPRPLPAADSARHLLIAALIAAAATATASEAPWVASDHHQGDFKLAFDGRVADLLVSADDFTVVQKATAHLADDVERVTGRRARVRNRAEDVSDRVVYVGTLGRSAFVDGLVQSGKLDVGDLRGQWESFVIATVPNPAPGVHLALAIVGSDRRGTAYGIYELSQAIGVSPWYWWADVRPRQRGSLIVRAGLRRAGPPSVQYRGVFLNDEDLGLQPWSAKTFEPELGDIGPKTYARLFELLLRLKANTVWPAMHECTRAFNLYDDNKRVADEYGIVMGSSHCEPMLRNNVTEWSAKHEDFDFTRNADGVTRYWEERVAQNGRFENIYTLGMRGIHDEPMAGPKTPAERVSLLERLFALQRGLLAKHVSPDVARIPQIFCPYKEVLADYRGGLQVPADVTVVSPDDNFGYVRAFPSAEELKRPGGFGVYYHLSYLGRPLSYIWLDTTPPALIWEEMSKAYEQGARKLWMLNVGDLKPGEIGTEFFLQMAWDSSRWTRENLPEFLLQWAAREFGAEHAPAVAAVMDAYYRLAYARKPEHMQWQLPGEPARRSTLTAVDYGDEIQLRLDAYAALLTQAEALFATVPAPLKDAFYELVTYPVRGATLANERFFALEKATLYGEQGRTSAARWAARAKHADAELDRETAYYNETLAGGKWRHMMVADPPGDKWQSYRSTRPVVPATALEVHAPGAAGLGVAIEGRAAPLLVSEAAALPALDVFTRGRRFIDVFNTGQAPAPWSARPSAAWIHLSRSRGDLKDDARVWVSIDWDLAPRGAGLSGGVTIVAAGVTQVVQVPLVNPSVPRLTIAVDFVESGGVVAIEAEHFTRKLDRAGAAWQVIPGLGRTGDSVAPFPTTAPSVAGERLATDAPMLEYSVQLVTTGQVAVQVTLIPTHPLVPGRGLRYAVAFDDETPQVVSVGADLVVPSPQWSQNVLNAAARGTSQHAVSKSGTHVLRVYMVDPGVVLDKLVIDAGGLKPSYLGPTETRIVSRPAGSAQKDRR